MTFKGFIAALAIGCSVSAAQAAQVYSNDFEGGLVLDGTGAIVSVEGYEGINDISGSYWKNDQIAATSDLTLIGLGAHTTMTIEFDLALLDSWDGGQGLYCCGGIQIGPDFFNILLDGVEILETSNFDPIAPELTMANFGNFGGNSAYRNDKAYKVSVTVPHMIGNAEISFFADGGGYLGGADESWAIDNLVISTNRENGPTEVPLPGGLPLMAGALGLFVLGWRRRA